MKKHTLLSILAISILIVSCNKADANKLEDNIAATVSGSVITTQDLDKEVKRFKKSFIKDASELTTEEQLNIKKQVLDTLIRKKTYEVEMDKLGIKSDKNMAQKQYSNLLMQYGSQDAVNAALEGAGFTAEEIMKEFEFQTRIENLTKYIHDLDIDVTDDEVSSYYEMYKESIFVINGSATARHILIKTNEGEEEALNKIKQIKTEINNGLDFAEAAIKYSQGPTGENGGLLGQFKKRQMVKEFEEVAFSQEVGVVSEPVLTQFGYHLILVDERVEDSISPLEEAKPFIIKTLKKDNYFKKLEENTNILKADWAKEEE